MISVADQQQLRDAFASMTRRVRLVFFTQTFGCETCVQTRQILDELPPLSDKIEIEEVNLVLERDRAAVFGIDRAPSTVVLYDAGEQPAATADAPVLPPVAARDFRDARMRFVGLPGGYEFISLVQAVLLAGGRASTLRPENLARLSSINRPLRIQVFTHPTCPHCRAPSTSRSRWRVRAPR